MADWLVVVGVSMAVMATVGLIRQAAWHGHSLVLFVLPVAGLHQVQENWEAYGRLALLRVAGLVITLAGLGLMYVDYRENAAIPPVSGQVVSGAADITSSPFVRSSEAALLMARGEGHPLTGRLHGTDLKNSQVTLVNGVLTVHQGDGVLPELSVSLLLSWPTASIRERRTLLVSPWEEGGPEIHLSWTPAGQQYPETRIIRNGYRLDLALAPRDPGGFNGTIQLVLPDQTNSYLVGDFTARTNHLRYRDGDVDAGFDHPDTLAWVSEQYLQTQFPAGVLQNVEVENVILRRAAGEGRVEVRLTRSDGGRERRQLGLEKTPVGWAVTPGSMTAGRQPTAEPPPPPKPPAPPGPDTSVPLTDLLVLAPLTGSELTVRESGGRERTGVLTRVASDRLWLRLALGAGSAEIAVDGTLIDSLSSNDGRRWQVAATAAATLPPEVPHGDPAEPHTPYQVLLGRLVRVTTGDGKTQEGRLQAVEGGRITLTVPVGAGTVEYFHALSDIVSMEAVR
ncbi:hypothetical protein [Alcanivorax sp. 24]|uniref:hypothetical protein n=1 Tax=Alcanivorax sp. 24 TaxID=2545266 RepID=UPI001060F394|nr:hypothetical protein [Alcanivorax sp. 24]